MIAVSQTESAVERLRANGLSDLADIFERAMQQQTAIVAFQRPEEELIETLSSSLYPGAKPASVKLVLNYCRASSLDPMLKPVHIVAMRCKAGTKTKGNGEEYTVYEMRDTIMPGIGLYRTQAAETNVYAGQDRPVYGPMCELKYSKKVVEWKEKADGKRFPVDHWEDTVLLYPEWCEVTVYKIVAGLRVAFTGQEYWLENYATAGRDTTAPNEMWERRSRAQLKKCAEAQALRMAFPNKTGAQPTADEMEGRTFDMDDTPEPPAPAEKKTPKRKDAPAPPPITPPPLGESDTVGTDEWPDLGPEPPPEGELRSKPAAATPAPAPKAPAPAPADDDTGELATDGECKFLVRHAERKGADLRILLDEMGLQRIPADTLKNLTKAKWEVLKKKAS